MNLATKHIVRNVIAFRRDFARYFNGAEVQQWRLELARHSMVPRAQWSDADVFMVKFASRQIREVSR